jgi:lysophospholipase L1-like esterase
LYEATEIFSDMEYILCVGDSLTFGARDEFHRSYPAELSRLFHEREGRFVYCVNHGISGETSSQLLRRIYANARSCPQARLALLLIGTNDTWLPQPVDIYRDNIRQIIGVLWEDREWVGVGLLPPIVGPGLPNYPRNGGAQVEGFNAVLREEASGAGCFLADFTGLGHLIIDTVHFGHRGYVAMAEIWYDTLRKHTKF